MMPDNSETIALRATVIAGKRYEDDFTVIWRGMSIGRIMQSRGVPAHLAQWSWNCSVHGKPGASANGNGADLEECKAKFKTAWAAWAMMILGFAGVSFMVYRSKAKPALMVA